MPGTIHDTAMNPPATAPPPMTPSQEAGFRLYGRRGEREMLDRVVADVRAGRRRVLVLRGEPGTGKTVLLDYLAGQAQGCRVVRMAGIEQEAELAFAGLHQLLAPILDRLERLPVPQREALRIAFGLSAGPAPDRFLVAMAVLTLLSDLSRERPLICVADDAQWLDQASAQALAFAARHLAAASAAVIFSVRQPACGRPLAGLPQFQLGGLEDADARALLSSVLIGPLDDGVRDRIIAEARGKPRALLEVTRGLTSGELAGGFGLPSIMPVPSWIEEDYRRQLALLPAMTQLLLLIAAAEPAGNPQLVWRAARHLGVQAMAADPAVAAGLAEFGPRVRFCHPQARAAIYRAATPQQRQSVHLALAETSGSDVGPDQRAWHRAHATSQPDEDVAAELIGTVGRARARGGLAAAAAFSERAAELTPEPACRARRALDAAEAKREAGALDAARRLLATAQGTALDELGRARAELLHAQLTVRPGDGRDGLPLLLDAARRLEPLDARLAREAYREAFCTALTAGRLDMADGVMQVAKAVRAAPPLPQPRAADLLLDGLAALVTDGHAVGAPMLRRAVRAFRDAAVPAAEALRWLPFACQLAGFAWDDESWHVLSARLIDLARQAGALAVFPDGLQDGTALWLATGETAAERASADPGELGLATRSLAELIEAAARTGAVEQASGALRRLSEATSVAGSDWALGIRARSTALLSGNEHAERLYLEAIERLGRTRIRAELARAHLLYGEWLRRQGRRLDAREQLRTAHQMLDAMGMEAFAERARKELAATGEAARKRTAETVNELTVQEAQIARLARDGHTNREISTKLFLSPRTVEWHLRKVFTKLGISSRRQLRTALPDLEQAPAAA